MNLVGFRLFRSAEQIGEPTARRMLTAEAEDGEGDRHADEGPEQAPQERPKEDRE
jgi:hypothetical protein